MSKNTIAVIGSNCFTGSHIVDALLNDQNNFVLGFSRSPEKHPIFLPYKKKGTDRFKFYQVDLFREEQRLLSLLDEYEPSVIINVAALSEVGLSNFQPIEYFQTNCLGVVRLCNELRSRTYLNKYIHISTAEVYGSCKEPLTEDAPVNPSTPYAVSKAAADMYLLSLHRNFKFPAIFIRSTNVYGRHQQLYKIIPRAAMFLKQGKKLELHGGGAAVKTWVHIRDVVDGIMKTIERGMPGHIYHFSDVHSYAISKLIRLICDEMGYDYEQFVLPVGERLGQDAQYVLNYKKAQTDLGWLPQVPFIEGLKEVIQWLDENWSVIQKEPHVYVHQP